MIFLLNGKNTQALTGSNYASKQKLKIYGNKKPENKNSINTIWKHKYK